ncbi:hypothetical protein BGZ52_002404 [Haplosporangium bisporale]|nr:hypothetical protein BGZ52_002404 [Haplosporangium bisporale]
MFDIAELDEMDLSQLDRRTLLVALKSTRSEIEWSSNKSAVDISVVGDVGESDVKNIISECMSCLNTSSLSSHPFALLSLEPSMFDIQELDELVCLQLDQKSLIHCAKVNKSWYEAATPYVWRTIPLWSWNKLREHVFEDYLQEKYLLEQQRLEDQPPPAKKPRQRSSSKKPLPPLERWKTTKPLALSKFGHCVRQTDGFDQLLKGLDQMTHEFFTSDELFDLALTILPRVTALSISGDPDRRTLFPFSKFKRVLTAASDHLYSLSLSLPKFQLSYECNAEAAVSTDTLEQEIAARPKRLQIHYLDSDQDWPWVWRACGQVKTLEVHSMGFDTIQFLTFGIRNSMPMLDSVTFGRNVTVLSGGVAVCEINDFQISLILSAGIKGWRAVHFGFTAYAGFQTLNRLLEPRHTATLEEFSIVRAWETYGILRLLRACPKLRKLVTIDDETHGAYQVPQMPVMDFIDWNPEAGAIEPWPCALTLETLAIKIADVPGRSMKGLRQDIRRYNGIQQQVFQRLGEFKNLKVLQLGHVARINAIKGFNRKKSEYKFANSEVPRQDKCVHLTFTTGLRKLEGLNNLEELYIPNMDHHIKDVREVRWMVEHWPRLSRLFGIGPQTDAHAWLQKNHPEISLLRKLPGH